MVMRRDGGVTRLYATNLGRGLLIRADATRTLSQLGDRLGWIECHIRTSGAATEVDFDDQAGELAPLVRKVRQGQQTQARLLADSDRPQLDPWRCLTNRLQRVDELTAATARSGP